MVANTKPSAFPTTREPSVLGKSSLGTSLLLVLPLFFIYELGLLVMPLGYNGVDFVTRHLIEFAGSRGKFLLLNLALATVLGFVIYRYRERVSLRVAALTIGESILWAGAMVGLAYLTFYLFDLNPGGESGFRLPWTFTVVASAGAGVHEELLFRLIIMCGGAWLIRACGIKHTAAVVFALLGSSVIFAAAHHVGPGGEPFQLYAFFDRTAGGLLLGAIAYQRSLAHAVYAHFLYDVYAIGLA
jgi:hypothetical protein